MPKGVCYNTGRTHFKKGQIPWNKGKKLPEITGKNNPMYGKNREGKQAAHWKGGISKRQGYIVIHKPDHPRANNHGYVKRCDLVMEKMLGRDLKPKELVHHKGAHFPLGTIENKQDDSPENLQLFENSSMHHKFHYSLRHINEKGQFM